MAVVIGSNFEESAAAAADHFNSIPEFCCALKAFEQKRVKDFIRSVGSLFLKHDMSDKFGLTLNHRHFLLNEEEILVETLGKEGHVSLAIPWTIKGLHAHPPTNVAEWEELGLTTKSHVIAQKWSFSTGGNLKAYEFLSTDKLEQAPPSLFVVELYEVLKNGGVEGILGLRRLDDDREGESYEVTPPGKRFSVTTIGGQPNFAQTGQEGTKVVWYFTREGELRETNYCGKCGSTCFICIG